MSQPTQGVNKTDLAVLVQTFTNMNDDEKRDLQNVHNELYWALTYFVRGVEIDKEARDKELSNGGFWQSIKGISRT